MSARQLLTIENLKPLDKGAPHSHLPDIYGPSGLSFAVNTGDFVAVLGKSGHGKSTLLELILGTRPYAGRIVLHRDGRDYPLEHGRQLGVREFGMMFQDLALFDSKTVWDNLAFPLELRGVEPSEQRRRVSDEAEKLQLKTDPASLHRNVKDLSGGERQRVALARLLMVPRRLYLFDEPLSSIDNPLHQLVVKQLLQLRKRLDAEGAAAVYVTHNQAEALSLGNRIIILKDGEGVVQDGPPRTIYQRPLTRFIAEFVGDPLFNFIPVKLQNAVVCHERTAREIASRCGGQSRFLRCADLYELLLPPNRRWLDEVRFSSQLALGFRPEAVTPKRDGELATVELSLKVRIEDCLFQGEEIVVYGEERDLREPLQIQLTLEEGAGAEPKHILDFAVALPKVILFYFPHGFVRDVDAEEEGAPPAFGVNVSHYELSNLDGR